MPLKLNSSGGGSVTLDTPSTASNRTATFPDGTGTVAVNGVSSNIVSGTAVASTSGTNIDFTGIPAYAKRITVMFYGVSVSGTSPVTIQLGTSGGVTTSGYLGIGADATTLSITNYTTGFAFRTNSASAVFHGSTTICLVNSASNVWAANGTLGRSDSATMAWTAGSVPLSGVLDRVRITTQNGTDTFDAGTINILWE